MESDKGKKIKGHEETQMDMLSHLPDCLIHHMLSFMDTKYAVQTCILSKRWLSLWTYLRNFNFDSRSFTRVDNLKRFIPFVLDHCNTSNVNAFRLYLHKGKIQHSLFNRIISFAVSHSVQEPDLSFNGNQGLLPLSLEVFKCQSLRVLKLARLEDFGTPRSFSLVSLKTLRLHKVPLENENQCFDLFSSCMNLQNLVLDDIVFLSMHPRMLKDLPSPFHNLKSLKVVKGAQNTKSIPPEVLNFLVRGSPMAEELLAKFQKKRTFKQRTNDWLGL